MNRKGNASAAGLLTVNAAAAFLKVSKVTLRRWDESGKFPARRHPLNGYRLYRVEDVERLKRRIDGRSRAMKR